MDFSGGRKSRLDSTAELLETRKRAREVWGFKHFHGTYSIHGELTLKKQIYLEGCFLCADNVQAS